MTTYYRMITGSLEDCTGCLKAENNPHYTFMRGEAVDEATLELPYVFTYELDDDERPYFLDYYDSKKLMRSSTACLRREWATYRSFPFELSRLHPERYTKPCAK